MVGVVVPMRNAERTIAATLDSISRQTHAKLDIVVVDDESTDGSVAIVAQKIRQDRRVRLVRQKNAGVAAARNTGAAATAASYLAFMDADDLWAPTKIEFQLDAGFYGSSKYRFHPERPAQRHRTRNHGSGRSCAGGEV